MTRLQAKADLEMAGHSSGAVERGQPDHLDALAHTKQSVSYRTSQVCNEGYDRERIPSATQAMRLDASVPVLLCS